MGGMKATGSAGGQDLPRRHRQYKERVVPEMTQRFGYQNPYQVPRLTKIVVSMGVGLGASDVKVIEKAAEELAVITGQRPLTTRAKVAISNFKIKRGQPIGLKVTLRKRRMYEFFDRLVSVAMPRIRDFRGMTRKGFDQGGNYAFGLSEQLIFPEVDYDKVSRVQGMNVVICTTAKSAGEAQALLQLLGMPFREARAEEEAPLSTCRCAGLPRAEASRKSLDSSGQKRQGDRDTPLPNTVVRQAVKQKGTPP